MLCKHTKIMHIMNIKNSCDKCRKLLFVINLTLILISETIFLSPYMGLTTSKLNG
jgi:hypothetical protein